MATKKRVTSNELSEAKSSKAGQRATRILTFTPVWQRPEVFEICLKGLARLRDYKPKEFRIQPFFVISESWAAYACMKYKFDFFFYKNHPLGEKKNAGLEYALKNFDFDYLLELGSDDLIASEYLDHARPWIESRIPQFSPVDCWFVDSITGNTAYWVTNKIIGLGRFIRRDVLEKAVNLFPLWNPSSERGMDTCSWRTLLQIGVGNQLMEAGGHYTLDIKSEVNVNHMGHFTASNEPLNKVLAPFPEAADILKLIESNKTKTAV